jgi:hypothetical protein
LGREAGAGKVPSLKIFEERVVKVLLKREPLVNRIDRFEIEQLLK